MQHITKTNSRDWFAKRKYQQSAADFVTPIFHATSPSERHFEDAGGVQLFAAGAEADSLAAAFAVGDEDCIGTNRVSKPSAQRHAKVDAAGQV